MTPLPIDPIIPTVIEGLARRSSIVVAPPGSGKTTRLPPAILESGLLSAEHPKVLVLQPRRIAARAAAARVADERGWSLGDQVGYQVRFERRVSRTTRLQFITEGILTRRLLADPFLESIGAVVLDEFHERNLHTDMALALLREVRQDVRPDLILVVMSATLDAEPVARFLGGCPIVYAEGRTHPVAVEYRPTDRPTSPEALAPLVQEWLDRPSESGHLLVFLPGLAEIRRACNRLEPLARQASALVLPLHGSFSSDEQDQALRPSDRRKIILSTNIAETSITIDGVDTVIDTGLSRSVSFDPDRGIDRWRLGRISRASADQRAGRAGRTGPGRCIRLWSQREERGFSAFEEPEIHRVDLSATVLALHSWGINDATRFGWFDSPSADRLAAAERLLTLLGAVDGKPPRISDLGRRMLELPVHPRLSRLLLASAESGRLRDGATIAALLSEKDILIRDTGPFPQRDPSRAETSADSDVLIRLDRLREAESSRFSPAMRSRGIDPTSARQVARIRDELIRLVGRGEMKGHGGDEDRDDLLILKAMLLAYPDRLVKRRGVEGTGLMVGGRGVRLAPGSVVRDADLYLALDAREDARSGQREVQVFLAALVRPEWLEELLPGLLSRQQVSRFDEVRDRVVSTEQLWFLDLLLREDVTRSTRPDEASRLLAYASRPEASRFFRGEPRIADWLGRVEFLRQAMPELNWPEFDECLFGEIIEQVCEGRSTVQEVRKVDLMAFLNGRLDPQQARELRESAPESLTLPNGRSIRLIYEEGRPPVLAARLQDLFGWTDTPRLARGRVALLLQILGPNHRPVQITQDLRSFWKSTYQQVRKDLRSHYPKHAWPDDPLNAPPGIGPRRKGSNDSA
ncbi:MAG: ATP-dependent helicase HrpB [Isosphaeraceae bacterium]